MSNEQQTSAQPQAPVPGSPEYNAAMAAKGKGEGAVTQPDAAPVAPMPEGGHDKFYNKQTGTYDWQSHAKELEYRAAQAKKPEQAPKDQPSEQEATDLITKAGLNSQELAQKLITSGKLDDADFEALAKVGVSRELAEGYAAGVKAQAEAARTAAFERVGGEDRWNKISAWAEANLKPEEKALVNQALAQPGWEIALDGLAARYAKALPGTGEPNLASAAGAQPGAPAGYTSKAQMKTDMASERYAKDPAFRAEVMQKMRHATWSHDPR